MFVAAHALAVLGNKDAEPLFVALADLNSQVRFFITIALGNAPKSPKLAHALRSRGAVKTDPVVQNEDGIPILVS